MNITTHNGIAITLHENYGKTMDIITANVITAAMKNKQHPGHAAALDLASQKYYLLSVDSNGNLTAIPEPEPDPELNRLTMTDGYVGGMGKTWNTPTAETLEQAVTGAMQIESKTREEIIAMLESGIAVRWCKSPNFYYDHSYGKIGRKKITPPVVMVECDCGHTIPQGQRMSASLGTSCLDCYDRMSS